MKLKQEPQDFFVEELTDVAPGQHGPFALYRLEKRGWTTADALLAIQRRWQIDFRRLGYGGLKDRHAETIQFISILHGPRRGLKHSDITLNYLGQIEAPYSSRCVRANRFRITLRDLADAQCDRCLSAAEEVRRDGIANYFDDQRFGSVDEDGVFVGKLMVHGQFEQALHQALAAPYEFDRSGQRKEKSLLRELWGQWAECKARLPRGHARSLVDYLVHHPEDFRGAVARLRPDLQGMYLSAYQSFLWNRIVSGWLAGWLDTDRRLSIATKLGELVMPHNLDDEQKKTLQGAQVTLPSARSPFDANALWADAARQVLEADGLQWSELKLRGLRKPFFTRGERSVLCSPEKLTATASADERHRGRRKLELAFALPRGSYATMVVKRITTASTLR